ncbi:MAG TPA: ATP-binding cassette domain-containing protein, partial [Solirubrobacteraceae bacterium]|nr:ATP-binding cassette domain-containing protein [Solirubrobacteraceae bacterium]
MIELRDAAKSYGAVRALRDANLSLRAGEVRALMGENGAGKSTLVKVLGGVIRRDSGDMLVEGTSVDFHSPHEARDAGIAVIYQEPTLFPDLSVAENVVMGYHPLGALSGHEVERLFGVVRTLREQGSAVLFISHRLEEVFELCDTVTVMRDGA